MIDPILSMAINIHSNPGVYALLIGSGVSRSASIPTGWEVVVDLIRKLATLEKDDCEPDPVKWYYKKYGDDPNYVDILERVGKTPAERKAVLKGYFEPTEEETEEGIKTPSVAHKAIAELVKNGYVKVILTTNFDRLIEKALDEAGITPQVISTPDGVQGASPLTHSTCTVIKVNGDYLDDRIKNTACELAEYDEEMNNLLDRVLDEFGLIVCGWSAEWDTALRLAVERVPNRRYSLYWSSRGKPTKEAQKLIGLRKGEVVTILDANAFFEDVKDKVLSLNDIVSKHPLAPKVAVETAKRYLAEEKYLISLSDLVSREVETLYAELRSGKFQYTGAYSNGELTDVFLERVRDYTALTDTLLGIFIAICNWGYDCHGDILTAALEKIADYPEEQVSIAILSKLKRLPALLLIYGGGVSAISRRKFGLLKVLLLDTVYKRGYEKGPLICYINTYEAFEHDWFVKTPGMKGKYTPGSDFLYETLREPLGSNIGIKYEEAFCKFEYFLSLVVADLELKADIYYSPFLGRFAWSQKRHRYREHMKGKTFGALQEVEEELDRDGQNWGPLKVGFFDGSEERVREIKKNVDETVLSLGWR